MKRSKLKTFIVEETACYYLRATTAENAERRFLNAITVDPKHNILCEVKEREVYADPEHRMIRKKEG